MNLDFIKISIQYLMQEFYINSPSDSGKFSKKSKVPENQFCVQHGLNSSKVAYTSMEFYILEESRTILEIRCHSWLYVLRTVLPVLLSILFSLCNGSPGECCPFAWWHTQENSSRQHKNISFCWINRKNTILRIQQPITIYKLMLQWNFSFKY